ncbi:MAG: hypothetical protein OXG85_00225 [Chloroflexi bacterium]|nr:hypothetical protein [Chloroflexota bacterium]
MYDRSRELDLRWHLNLAVENMLNTLDERQDYLPFFHYELIQQPTRIQHGPFDSPHVVGRYLDALGCCAPIIGLPDAPEIYDALARQLYDSLERHPTGLPWNAPTPWQPNMAVMHNCREVILGLLALWHWRGASRAALALRRLCRSILAAIGDEARFPGECLGEAGWTSAFNGILATPPATSGRMIRALVQYFRRSQDEVALDLARRFAADNLATAFDADGSITAAAGTHIHSITGTITGLIEYGILVDDERFIEGGRRAYDVGMRPFRSSYGWVKEFRWENWLAEALAAAGYAGFDINRGEANNTGDLIEAALLLGGLGYAGYYEDADRMLRNHLLASQVVETDWVTEAAALADTAEARYGDVGRRARGGFCFGSPNDLISYPQEAYQVNADLVGGSTQAIREAWRAIAETDETSVQINLLYSKRDPAFALTCPPPGQAPISIRLARAETLRMRIPSWALPAEVGYAIDDSPRRSAEGLIDGGYLQVADLEPGAEVKIWLPERQETAPELVGGKRYDIDWHNDTVVGIEPPARFRPLYGRDNLGKADDD